MIYLILQPNNENEVILQEKYFQIQVILREETEL